MTIKILFSANEENWKRYKAPLQDALDDKSLDYELGTNITPSEVDYIISVSYTHLTLPTTPYV